MGYLPIFLAMEGRRCVVIGGGVIATRKVAQLVAAGAQVTIVSPALTPALEKMAAAASIEWRARNWITSDLDGFALAFAATDDPAVHREARAKARSLGVLINIADEPEGCDFIAPAVVHRGDLQIAVSTSGASPAMAARIRRELEAQFGWEHAAALRVMRAARKYLRANDADLASRAKRLARLAESDLASKILDGDRTAIERLLREVLGAGLDDLAVDSQLLPEDWLRDAPSFAVRGG